MMGPSSAQSSARPWQQSSRTPDAGAAQHRRDRHDDSWVEISSQPSSSSLSSIGDEVITTGLRVGGPSHGQRQKRLGHGQRRLQQRQGAPSTAAQSSSQDEYDETESEDDHFLTSSGEKLSVPSTPSRRVAHPDADTDDDEKATTLGRLAPNSPPSFRPQPNAFSHPPTAAAFPPNHPHSAVRGGPGGVRSLPNQRSGGPSFMSPGGEFQPDNDAALRASLTTLLSCAAAARGIPKDPKEAEGLPVRPGGRVSPSSQPVELRLVPEAELLAPSPPAPAPPAVPRESSRRSVSDTRSKRRSTTAARSPRATKKHTVVASEDSLINPTLLTWVMSAGVVVLVSVVGFGAGYVIGREVGKQEGMGVATSFNASSVGETAAGCGREVIRSSGGTLRKFRWGTDIARSVVAS